MENSPRKGGSQVLQDNFRGSKTTVESSKIAERLAKLSKDKTIWKGR